MTTLCPQDGISSIRYTCTQGTWRNSASRFHFQDLFFLLLKIVLNDLGCMFRVINLLQDTFWANHMSPWGMIDFLALRTPSILTKLWNHLLRCSLKLARNLHRASPALQRTNCLLLQRKIFQFLTHQSTCCCHCFGRFHVFVHSWVAWPCFYETLPWRLPLASINRKVDGSQWFLPVLS